MKWLDSLREKWRNGNDEERAINEAVAKQLTPEMKLAMMRSQGEPDIWWVVRAKLVIFFAVFVLVLLAVTAVVGTLGCGLKQYFGENVWENITNTGAQQFKTGLDAINILIAITVAVVIIAFVYFLARFVCDCRKESRLKKEILERLKRLDSTNPRYKESSKNLK